MLYFAVTRRHLVERYRSDAHIEGVMFLRPIAEAAAIGFIAGLLLGMATGHLVLSLVPAAILAVVFAALQLFLGWLRRA